MIQYRSDTNSDVRWTVENIPGHQLPLSGWSQWQPLPTQITHSISSSHLQLEHGPRNNGHGWSRYHAAWSTAVRILTIKIEFDPAVDSIRIASIEIGFEFSNRIGSNLIRVVNRHLEIQILNFGSDIWLWKIGNTHIIINNRA